MKKSLLIYAIMLLCLTAIMFGAQETEKIASEGGGIDWFQLIVVTGYLLGVFVLLPLVIYTNLHEKLFNPTSDDKSEIQILTGLSEEERNERASKILERIGEKLTPFKGENGEEMITITNGFQAKFMKRGLDYINKYLVPTDQELIDRVAEFTVVYEDRTKRAFTGSNWIIACSAGIGILMLVTAGFSTFIIIHILGLVFYILSSRTTFYGIEKRMKYFGGGAGLIGGIMGGLFLGAGAKQYVRYGSGPWKRDWEAEGQMAIIGLLIMFVVAMFLGFLAVVLGVLNFVINYSTSFLLPFKKEDKWYEDNFEKVAV